jgi:8-oxo-dGTP pyrophosphatase MutT (NUDIX family)
MPGKTDLDAALQEAFEEGGIHGIGDTRALGSYRFQKAMHDGSELNCLMSVYGMSEVRELESWPEMDQRERRWVPQADTPEIVFDWNLARFLVEVRFESATGKLNWKPSIAPTSQR